jgi:fructose-1-phosphate kinase PfkB-like protein
MIITLTPNPTVDKTLFLDHLAVNEVNRYDESQLDPAGKGINVSRVAHRLGWPTIAFGFHAGEIGAIADRALDEEGVSHHFVPVPGQTRLNVTIVDRGGRTFTSLYGIGPPVSQDRLAILEGLVRFWLQAGRVWYSLEAYRRGRPEDLHARYIELARTQGVETILDADGAPFSLGVAARPNAH